MRWRKAVQTAAAGTVDPWAARNLHERPMEHCVRLRYNNLNGAWLKDDGEELKKNSLMK